MRTIVDLPDSQIAELSILEKQRKTSRAQLVREAIARFLKAEIAPEDAGFGAWQQAGAQQDGVAYQQALRAEWDR